VTNSQQNPVLPPVIWNIGQGRTLSMLGVTVTFKMESDATDGAYALWEYSAPAHFDGPAAHYHKLTDEAFYILEGTPLFQLEDQVIQTQPGSFVFVPRNTLHRFSNPGSTPIRMLTFRTPGGTEGYFDALITLIQESGGMQQVTRDDMRLLEQQHDQYAR